MSPPPQAINEEDYIGIHEGALYTNIHRRDGDKGP